MIAGQVPWHRVALWEDAVAAELRNTLEISETQNKELKENSNSNFKWLKIGAAGVAGGVALFFTGGLAAPAVGGGMAASGLFGATAVAVGHSAVVVGG